MTNTDTTTSTPALCRGVQFCKKDLYNEFVPPPQIDLQQRALHSLGGHLASINHHPTADMWKGLEAVVSVLVAMAEGRCPPSIHISSLDPGVGKTTAISHFLKALLASEDHEDAAVLICLKRREQIEGFIKDARFCQSDFAVLTSDSKMNALGNGDTDGARILFTTHSMVEKRVAGGSFNNVKAFHYLSRPRSIRIWDEAILPGQPLVVSRDAVASLLEPLRGRYPALAGDLEDIFNALKSANDRSLFHLPNLEQKHGLTLKEALVGAKGASPGTAVTAETLQTLLGRVVTVRRDGAFGNALVAYRDTLPDDLAPILVLDASARVRTTYRLWDAARGGLSILPSAAKTYANLTIHHWDHAGGKSGTNKHLDRILEGCVATIRQRPTEPWLIVHHLDAGKGDFEPRELRRRSGALGRNLHFLHWGIHDATNAYAHIPNVILAGTLHFRPSYHEALAQLTLGARPEDGPVTSTLVREIAAGELRHLLLQAICRGSVRRCDGGVCPRANAYVIGSSRSGVGEALKECFPGARIVPWKPVLMPLKGKVKQALDYITAELIARQRDHVTAAEVMRAIGWSDAGNFRNRIRANTRFVEELAARNLIEHSDGRQIVFWPNPFAV